MKRRALSFLLALAMIVSLVGTNNIRAFADDGIVAETSIVEEIQTEDAATEDAAAEDPDAAGPEEDAASDEEAVSEEDADAPSEEDSTPAEDPAADESVIEDSSAEDAEEAADEDAAAEEDAEEAAQPEEEAADESEAEEPAAEEIADADEPEEVVIDEPAETTPAPQKEDVDKEEEEKLEEAEEEEVVEGTKAAAIGKPDSTVLCFTSDTHNKSGNAAANRLGNWLDMVAGKYGGVTLMAFGGDMAGAGASGYWDLAQADMDKLTERTVDGYYTTGNHEISYGGDFSYSSYSSGSYLATETKGQFRLDQEVASGNDYRIYCLGSRSSSESYSNQISALTTYLKNAGNDKVIFIITHFPLHTSSYRTTSGAASLIGVLNNAVTKYKQTIVFLWGHNHSVSDTYYDQIYGPGTSLSTDNGNQTIQFYYGAAGCMSDSENGTGSAYVKGKGLVVTIAKNRGESATLGFSYFNEGGTDVTENSSDSIRSATVTLSEEVTGEDPEDPTPSGGDTSVDITPTTSNPSASATIAVGETLTINVTNGSSSSAYDFTATLGNSGVAQLGNTTVNIAANGTGQFTVTGLASGTVDITISNGSNSYSRKGTIHLTVGDGSSTPTDPTTGTTVEITPTTSNPSASATIAVGETLTINVTNGSSSSAYDFTATLGNSGVAQLGNTTVNIAANGTGQFTVTGLASGTVDITISNGNNSYSRKGTIHLTVGDGSSSQTGNSVSITPTTDSPEDSATIAVEETLTIIVNNSSTRSAYDFTATLSNSGIAEIQGNSTVNIAAGGTGQFTVKGLASGTVDITIQNENSTSAQYNRIGTIHLTVGEGGTTPTGEETTYVLTDTMEAGKEYLIATSNSGSGYILSSDTYSSGSTTGLKGVSVNVADSKITITSDVAAKTLFTASGSDNNSIQLKMGSSYLYADSNGALRLNSSAGDGKYWHYKDKDGDVDKNLLWFFKDSADSSGSLGYSYSGSNSTYRYYLEYDANGNFTKGTSTTTSLADTSTPKIYLYVKDDSTPSQPVAVTGVSLDKSTLSLEEGASGTLTATVLPTNATTKTVTWSTDAPGVATVSNGTVTAVGTGTATITVTTTDGGFTATCVVNVTASTKERYELVSSLEAGGEYLIVSANSGSAYALKNPGTSGTNINNTSYKTAVTVESGSYILTSDTDIVWTAAANGSGFNLTNNGLYLEGASGNVGVYNPQTYSDRYWTYNSSNYLQHNGGSNTYTLRYSSSSNYFQGATSNPSAVYLFKKASNTPGITLDKSSMSVPVGETGKLTATVRNAEGATVTWTSSNTNVATVSGGTVSGVAAGEATITASITVDGKTYSAACEVTVAVIQSVDYVLTDTMEAGKEYLIATSNSGSGYILSSDTYSSGSTTGLKGVSVNVADSKITITSDVAEKTLFTASGSDNNSIRLMIGSQYLYADGSGNLRMVSSISDAGKFWHYMAEDNGTDKRLLWFFNGTDGNYGYTATGNYKYYLSVSNGNFTKGYVDNNNTLSSATNIPKIYLYVKDDGTPSQPVAVTGVSLDKSTLSLEEGASGTLTATVLPTNATTKTVTWSTDTPGVATVSNGTVTAVGTGTATITVTTTDGGFTATCVVNVTASTKERYELVSSLEDGGEYLIVNANSGSGYALKNPGTSGTNIANTSYKTAVTVESGSYILTSDTDIVWTAAATDGGFHLTNNGLYLEGSGGNVGVYSTLNNADRAWSYTSSNYLQQPGSSSSTYTLRYSSSSNYFQGSTSNTGAVYLFKKASTTPGITLDKSSMSVPVGETGKLTATVRNAEGAAVTWTSSNTSVATVSGGTVSGVAAGTATITASITVDGTTYSATCTVTVAVIQMIDFVQTDTFEAGKEYLIVSGNTGNVLILSNEAGSSSQLKGIAATVSADGKISIEDTVAEKALFSSVANSNSPQNGIWLMNGSQYLYADSTNGLGMVASSTQTSSSNNAKSWHYKADDKYLLWFFKDTSSQDGYTDTGSTYRYYLDPSSGSYFTDAHVGSNQSLSGTTTPAIYLFVRDDGSVTEKYTITFKNDDGSTLKTYTLEAGATPSYDGATPTKAATAQYTYTFAGWTPEITAVTGNATYTATYTSEVRKYTVKFVNYDGTELQSTQEAYGATPAYAGEEPTRPATSQYSYVFTGWSPAIEAVTGDATYTAQYTTNSNKYIIQFKDDEGKILQSTEEFYGVTPAYTGPTPTKPDSGSTVYTFAGWNPAITSVTGDAVYTATFTSAIRTYTIKFVNDDGTELLSITVPDGETPVYSGAAPTKAADAQYTYTFKGWDKDIVAATADATYTATYTSTVNKYLIKFVNDDGTLLQSSEVEYGTMPSYSGPDPEKTATDQYTYTFASWDKALAVVTGEATYTATYTSTVNKYTIRFVNEDGTLLQSSQVEFGKTPSYSGATPTKAATAQYTYTFEDWSPVIVSVTGNATYTATYESTLNKYSVKFVYEDGEVLQEKVMAYGSLPAYTGTVTPTKAATAQYTYTFEGWTPALTEVTGEAVYTATFSAAVNKYTIKFVNEDGSVLQSEEVAYGEIPVYSGATPTKAPTAQDSYAFAGWDKEVVAVTGAATYRATFTSAANSYMIKFVNDDGTELQSIAVPYGETPNYTGGTPTKAATAQYSYTFSGWSPAVVPVTEEATYTATFTRTTNQYLITFVNDDGTELQSGKMLYGNTPSYIGSTPTKEADDEWTYTFSGWNPSITTVTGEATYTAEYTRVLNKHTVKFIDANGTVLESKELSYGATPTYTKDDPVKEEDENGHYTFAGWSTDGTTVLESLPKVDGDMIFKAVYDVTAHEWTYVNFTWTGNSTDGYSAAVANYTCSVNGEEHATTAKADISKKTTAATCETTGSTKYTATVSAASSPDGTKHTASKSVTISKISHKLTKTAAQDPTCTVDGNTAYWTCSLCGKYFSDSKGKTEIEEGDWIVDATGHTWKKPTWKWTGSAAKGYTAAKATFVCANDSDHTKTKSGTIKITTTEATAKASGKIVYKATAKGPDGKSYTSTKTVTFGEVLMNTVTAKGDTSLVIKWTKVKNVEGYDIFLGQCNSKTAKYEYKKVKTIKGNSTFTWTATDLAKQTAHKVRVKAYVTVDGEKVYVRSGDTAHVFTSGGGKKYTNTKAVVLEKPSSGKLTLKKGKTYTIEASLTVVDSTKETISEGHAPFYRYVSDNTSVATVSSKGVITAKAAGSCKIYVYTVNGAYKAITVTVN